MVSAPMNIMVTTDPIEGRERELEREKRETRNGV